MTDVVRADHALLAERARRIAAAPPNAPRGDELTVVAFALGGEDFLIEARWVREVAVVGHRAQVPGAPDAIRGVMTHHGEIVALIDVRAALRRGTVDPTDARWALVLGGASAESALLADAVTGVERVRVADIGPRAGAPEAGSGLARSVAGRGAVLLDGEAFLRDENVDAALASAQRGGKDP